MRVVGILAAYGIGMQTPRLLRAAFWLCLLLVVCTVHFVSISSHGDFHGKGTPSYTARAMLFITFAV